MLKHRSTLSRGKGRAALLGGLLAAFMLFAFSACGGNNVVHVYDNAHVLDTSRVQNEAANLSYPLDIYTTSTFTGNKQEFQQTTVSKLNSNPQQIVMAIDTTHRYLYVARGANVPL